MLQIEGSGTPLTNDMIIEFEAKFEIKLPDDYVEFMKLHNGGYVQGNMVFDFIELGDTEPTGTVLRCFLSFSDEQNGLSRVRERIVNDEAPPSLLLIADDVFGNPIFIGVSGDDIGKVIFGNHELEDPETGYLVMSPISDSFNEFIGALHPFTDE